MQSINYHDKYEKNCRSNFNWIFTNTFHSSKEKLAKKKIKLEPISSNPTWFFKQKLVFWKRKHEKTDFWRWREMKYHWCFISLLCREGPKQSVFQFIFWGLSEGGDGGRVKCDAIRRLQMEEAGWIFRVFLFFGKFSDKMILSYTEVWVWGEDTGERES